MHNGGAQWPIKEKHSKNHLFILEIVKHTKDKLYKVQKAINSKCKCKLEKDKSLNVNDYQYPNLK